MLKHNLRTGCRRTLLKKLCLLAGSLAIALLAAELALRAYHYYLWRTLVSTCCGGGERSTIVACDTPGLIYRCRPNTNGTNSHGYFDREYPLEKPPGVFRIVVIGDSVAGGQGIDWRQSFPKQLEDQLNQTSQHQKYEVVVLSCTGYSTSQELVLLRTEAFEYHPDLILWSYVLNDPAHPLYHDANGELSVLYQPKSHLAHLAWKGWFGLRERIKARGGPEEYHQRLHYVYWKEVAGNLGEIGRLCREQGVPAVLVIHPVFEAGKGFEEYSLLDLHENLKTAVIERGLVPIDLLPAYRGHWPTDLALPMDPWHPNLMGHRLTAQFLYERLLDRGLDLKIRNPKLEIRNNFQ